MGRKSVDIIGKIDWITVLLYLCLTVCGWLSVCGASADLENPDLLSFATRPGKQLVWILCAIAIGVLVLSITKDFYSTYSYIIYLALLALLVITIFVAEDTKGSHSWLKMGPVSIQPAEFAKFGTALALARFIDRYEFNIDRLKDILSAVAIFMVPMILIVLQSETGSALVYLAFLLVLYREGMTGNVLLIGFCAILFFILGIKFGGVSLGGQPYSMGRMSVLSIIQILMVISGWIMEKNRTVGIGLLILEIGVTLVGFSLSLTVTPFNVTWLQMALILAGCIFLVFHALKDMVKRYILIVLFALGSVGYLLSVDYVFNEILRPHQQTRINVILGLEDDPLGKGYNVNQSLIAIGSGGLSGKGFMKGTQTKLKYVPEQDTDFIFCTVGEEKGFLGSAGVLILYLCLLLRLISVAERQTSAFGRVYGYSVASILFFHLFVNVGMVLGITPVIGIPLPFFSYGGSSLWGFTILLAVFLRIDCERNVRV